MPTNKPLTEDTLQLVAESYGVDHFLRLKDIVPAQKGAPGLVPFSRATLRLKVKAETFPQPIKNQSPLGGLAFVSHQSLARCTAACTFAYQRGWEMILRPPQVAQQMGYKHASAVYSLVQKGLLTQPVKIGRQASGWPANEIQAWVDARAGGADDITLRSIVSTMQEQRLQKLAALKTSLGLEVHK